MSCSLTAATFRKVLPITIFFGARWKSGWWTLWAMMPWLSVIMSLTSGWIIWRVCSSMAHFPGGMCQLRCHRNSSWGTGETLCSPGTRRYENRSVRVSPKMEGLVQADKMWRHCIQRPIVAVRREVTDLYGPRKGVMSLSVFPISVSVLRMKSAMRNWRRQTRGIDVILGGHSHTFMEKPAFCLNAEGKYSGIAHREKRHFVGELDLTLTKE